MVRPRMTLQNLLLHSLAFSFTLVGAYGHNESAPSSCTILPLGTGMDDTQNILNTISQCGTDGHIVLEEGNFNITSKMHWNLTNTHVDLYGTLSFIPDIEYWLNASNTYRVVFIQNQASWFVVSGSNFTIDAHNVGGINGNGQPWWNYFTNATREDGDGRPLSLTLYRAFNAKIKNFQIFAQPFWCNTVAESTDVVYDGMKCNATNENPEFFSQNIVPNTDGINTYRADKVQLLNWDITCGDDCLAVKGNSTNLYAKNYTCRGGNGVAFGSLGQYVDLSDIVQNVTLEDFHNFRINTSIQPNMGAGVYLKSWTGTVNGSPPTGGGGGTGLVKNITAKHFLLGNVSLPIHLYQTNGGHSNDTPSFLQFEDLFFYNFTGTSSGSTIVDIECSTNAPCPNVTFGKIDVTPPPGSNTTYKLVNVIDDDGMGLSS